MLLLVFFTPGFCTQRSRRNHIAQGSTHYRLLQFRGSLRILTCNENQMSRKYEKINLAKRIGDGKFSMLKKNLETSSTILWGEKNCRDISETKILRSFCDTGLILQGFLARLWKSMWPSVHNVLMDVPGTHLGMQNDTCSFQYLVFVAHQQPGQFLFE